MPKRRGVSTKIPRRFKYYAAAFSKNAAGFCNRPRRRLHTGGAFVLFFVKERLNTGAGGYIYSRFLAFNYYFMLFCHFISNACPLQADAEHRFS